MANRCSGYAEGSKGWGGFLEKGFFGDETRGFYRDDDTGFVETWARCRVERARERRMQRECMIIINAIYEGYGCWEWLIVWTALVHVY